MPSIWSHLFKAEKRLSVDDYAELVMKYQGTEYMIGSNQRYGNSESIENDFVGYVNGAYKANGIVFACMLARMMVFSEGRFMFQRLRHGRPEDMFGTKALRILESPWVGGTTGELLSRAIQDADLAGNHYVVTEGGRANPRARRLRPDWVEIILSAPPDEAVKSDVIGHIYRPGNTKDPDRWEYYPIDGSNGRVAHWSPIPDPEAQYRGMSWLTPVVREIQADKAATAHKAKFFENAATPNLAVAFDSTVTIDQFKAFMEMMNEQKHGIEHAYETLYLGGGADVTVVGKDLAQMDFKVTQGAGETRIAAAARVHPVIVGLSEGMQGSSLNAGNYGAAKRSFADGTMRPLWRSVCAAYANLVTVPTDTRLWIDTRDIAFLRDDQKDLAEIQGREAETIAKLTREGYTWDSIVEAVTKEDWRFLKHTGLFSVQLQPPGSTQGSGTTPVPAPPKTPPSTKAGGTTKPAKGV